MDDSLPLWVTIIIGILTGIGGGFGTWILSLYGKKRDTDLQEKNADQAYRLTEMQEAVKVYREYATGLKEDLRELDKHTDAMELENKELIKENVELKLRLSNCEKQIESNHHI